MYEFSNPGSKRKERQARMGKEITPSSGLVAEAVLGKFITRAEGRDLNSDYVQHIKGSKAKPLKKSEPKQRPKKAAPAQDYEIRVVNGREFKVYKLAEDKSVPGKVRKAERNSTRTIYRPKGIKY